MAPVFTSRADMTASAEGVGATPFEKTLAFVSCVLMVNVDDWPDATWPISLPLTITAIVFTVRLTTITEKLDCYFPTHAWSIADASNAPITRRGTLAVIPLIRGNCIPGGGADLGGCVPLTARRFRYSVTVPS